MSSCAKPVFCLIGARLSSLQHHHRRRRRLHSPNTLLDGSLIIAGGLDSNVPSSQPRSFSLGRVSFKEKKLRHLMSVPRAQPRRDQKRFPLRDQTRKTIPSAARMAAATRKPPVSGM